METQTDLLMYLYDYTFYKISKIFLNIHPYSKTYEHTDTPIENVMKEYHESFSVTFNWLAVDWCLMAYQTLLVI